MADDNSKKLMTLDTFAYALQRIEARYQVKESGKGLSTNDFTDEYKNKLDNIAPDEIIATEEEVDEVIDEVFGEDDEPTEDAGAAEDSYGLR